MHRETISSCSENYEAQKRVMQSTIRLYALCIDSFMYGYDGACMRAWSVFEVEFCLDFVEEK